MRITERTVSRNMLSDIQRSLGELEKVRRQAATGRQISKASEDPVRAARSLNLRTVLDDLDQHKKNSDEAKGWIEMSLAALSQARELVQDAKIEAQKTGTETMPPEARRASADILKNIKKRLVDVANTRWRDSYVFGGHKTTAESFAADGTYSGDQGEIVRAIAPGETVKVNYDGRQVFIDNGNLFQILDDAIAALEADDVAAIRGMMGDLDAGVDKILELEAVLGADSKRVEDTKSRLEDMTVTLESLQSENDEVDVTKAIITLQSLQNAYSAALTASSKVFQESLLRFLQ